MGAVISVLLGVIIALVTLVWREMRAGFRQHRQGETARCENYRQACREEVHREFDAMRDAIKVLHGHGV